MGNAINNNNRNPLPTEGQAPKEPGRTAQPKPKAKEAPAAPTEQFSVARDPVAPKAASANPMAGAFTSGKRGPNSLSENAQVREAASRVLAKTQGAATVARVATVSGGLATAGAVGLSLLVPPLAVPAALGALGALAASSGTGFLARRSGQKAVQNDPELKRDVEQLKSAQSRLSGQSDLSQVENDTLALSKKGLKF